MFSSIRSRLASPSLVVAIVALVAALSGTAVAAKYMVTSSSQIKNGTIRGADIRNSTISLAKLSKSAQQAISHAPGGGANGANGQNGAPGPQGPAGPQGPQGPQGPAGGGPITDVAYATGGGASTYSSTSWTEVAGASTTVHVQDGHHGHVMARFAAESACYGADTYCGVRILVDGVELAPTSGSDFAFDSSDNNSETSSSWESHATERISDVVGPGSHTVKVEVKVHNGAATLRLDDWTLVAENIG